MSEARFESYLALLEQHGASMRRGALRRMAGIRDRAELTSFRQSHPDWKAREAKLLAAIVAIGGSASHQNEPLPNQDPNPTTNEEPPREDASDEPGEAGESPLSSSAPQAPRFTSKELSTQQRRFLTTLRRLDDRAKACEAVRVEYTEVKLWCRENAEFKRHFEAWREDLLIRNEDSVARKGAEGDTSAAKAYLAANSVRYRTKGEEASSGGPLEDLDVARERDFLFREVLQKSRPEEPAKSIEEPTDA